MIVRLEKGLKDTVELVWTKTRNPKDAILTVNPSGRIPFLVLADGTGFEDSDVIIDYLDRLSAPLQFVVPEGEQYWHFRRVQAVARSMLDGVSLWAREVMRPQTEQSAGVIKHERLRALRLADYFEIQVNQPPLLYNARCGGLNLPQILLFCALETERRNTAFDWRASRPCLSRWHDRIISLSNVRDSLPPLQF